MRLMSEPYSIQPGLTERLLPAIRSVMTVHDVTSGDERQGFALRVRGRLTTDPQEAFDRLDPLFRAEGVTLLTKEDQGQEAIIAVPGVIMPTPSNPWVNALLFALTVISVLIAGALYGLEGPIDPSLAGMARAIIGNIPGGLSFALSLLAILVAHEFGHYLAARYHRTAVTLPYFLPFPGSLFGTLGAFIRLKEPPKNKRVLLDIGLAGPLAGLVVAIPVLLVGLALSDVSRLPLTTSAAAGHVLEGNSLLYLLAKFVVKGEWLPAPLHFGGVEPSLYWLRYFFLGLPMPLGGQDVMLHPMAWAGWAGLLVTSLNLIPAGQLDGGHVLFVLFGKSAARIWPFIVVILFLMGFVWSGWYIWAVLIFLLGRTFAQPRDGLTRINPSRRALAIFGMILFILVFTPVPLRLF
jgi:membrane-associated protease RseP (regulator of RpoE activity)